MGDRNTLDYAGPNRDGRPANRVAQFGIGCGGSILAGVLAVGSAILLIAAIGGSEVVFDSACAFVAAALLLVSVGAMAYFANLAVRASQQRADEFDEDG